MKNLLKLTIVLTTALVFFQSCKPKEPVEPTTKEKLCVTRTLKSGYDSTFIKINSESEYFFSTKTEYTNTHISYVFTDGQTRSYNYTEQISLSNNGDYRQTTSVITTPDTAKTDFVGTWEFTEGNSTYKDEERFILYTNKLIANDTLEMNNNGFRPDITCVIKFLDTNTLKIEYEYITTQGTSNTKIKGEKTFSK